MTFRWEPARAGWYGIIEGHIEDFARVSYDRRKNGWGWRHWTGQSGTAPTPALARAIAEVVEMHQGRGTDGVSRGHGRDAGRRPVVG